MRTTKAFLPVAFCTLLLVKDIIDWTRDQIHAYFDKYNIGYDKNADENTIMNTVKQYHDAAVTNFNSFFSDQDNQINRLMAALKLKLETQYKLASTNVDALIKDIKHRLTQLEISGHLTQDRVKNALDQMQHDAVQKKYITETQWKDISTDLESSFAGPNWLQRVLSGWGGYVSDSSKFPEKSIHTWIDQNVVQRLEQNKELTQNQIQSVLETLRNSVRSITSSDVTQLGDRDWWNKFKADLEATGKLKEEQIAAVVESIKNDVIGYKISMMDYGNYANDRSNQQHVFSAAIQYIRDTSNSIYGAIRQPMKNKEASLDSAISAASSAASSAAATVTSADFGQFWKTKEFETYRKLGYTEANIEWIQNFLSKNFNTNTIYAREAIHNALQAIRQYMTDAKVQSAAAIDDQLKAFENLVDSWKRTLSH
ncbi:hypothetical protein K501DRAFT_328240 [Backusella circina FSU 941]|nr:hypothetical protein K501DRAFT_328240 [Backusella circina FSU 941]